MRLAFLVLVLSAPVFAQSARLVPLEKPPVGSALPPGDPFASARPTMIAPAVLTPLALGFAGASVPFFATGSFVLSIFGLWIVSAAIAAGVAAVATLASALSSNALLDQLSARWRDADSPRTRAELLLEARPTFTVSGVLGATAASLVAVAFVLGTVSQYYFAVIFLGISGVGLALAVAAAFAAATTQAGRHALETRARLEQPVDAALPRAPQLGGPEASLVLAHFD